MLTATSGNAKGLKLEFAAGHGRHRQLTVTGAQGTVAVTDNSLVFQIGANQNQTAQIAIQKVNPNGLGTGVADNQFTSLDDIDVTSASQGPGHAGDHRRSDRRSHEPPRYARCVPAEHAGFDDRQPAGDPREHRERGIGHP